MPQMSPIKWLMLFMFFSIILLMFNMINYFSFSIPFKKNSNHNNTINTKKNKNWKW